MKTILFIALSFTIAFSSFSQKIEEDKIIKINGNEIRLINVTQQRFRSLTDKIILYAGLSAEQFQADTIKTDFKLHIKLDSSKPISAPKGTRILIKTTEDKVLELQDDSPLKDNGNYLYSDNLNKLNFKLYSIHFYFPLTENQINDISKGVTKVRIELDGGKPYEKSWGKDKVGNYIKKSIEPLKTALNKNKRETFSEGF